MPGLFLTASRPLRTFIDSAPYNDVFFSSDFLDIFFEFYYHTIFFIEYKIAGDQSDLKLFTINNYRAKKNLISSNEFEQEMKSLQVKFQQYKQNKFNEIEELKKKRNKNILIFLNQINPIIEKFMTDNSIYMIIDKKNVFIASKEYNITNNLIELIDNQIKSILIE